MYGAGADGYIALDRGSVLTQQWRMFVGETEE